MRLKGLPWMPEQAVLLNDGSKLTVTHGTEVEPPVVTLRGLPVDRMNDEIQVIRLEFDENVIHAADSMIYEDHSAGVEQG